MSNWNTDGCTSAECSATLAAPDSLTQGQTFAGGTKDFHGGRRTRRAMRGGAAAYPGGFSQELPPDLHKAAYVSGQDAAFADLPRFVGQYGMSGGRRRARRNSRKARRGGGFGYTPGDATAPNYMILTPAEESAAQLNPQWYTENLVVPSYQAPVNGYAAAAQAAYANQADYKQHAGSRKNRKASRKGRKASRKNRKASRKDRKASRKNRKASRKDRK